MGLHILLLLDEREKRQAQVDALKLAIVGSDPMQWAHNLFPEMFEEEESGEVEGQTVSSKEDLADTEGAWKFTQEIDPEEAQRIMASMVADPSGTLSAVDLSEDGWG